MTTETSGGGSGEDVNEFLQRIKELGEKRDQEDAERARKLEEEIIAGRQARRARREERARSISPQKDSPLLTAYLGPSAARGDAPGVDAAQRGISDITLNPTDQEGSASVAPKQPPLLSWQKKRSKSVHSVRSTTSPTPDDRPASRGSIAAAFESKDPTFFRQTADRIANSGALRKGEDESHEATNSMALPGMSSDLPHSRETTPEPMVREPEKRLPRESMDTVSSITSIDNSSETVTPRQSGNFSLHGRSKSISSSSAERFERPPQMSPSQGRISPDKQERTASPTKGLGGFVQSAMLKREGSINKRWSNTPYGGQLSRKNSVATERPVSMYGRPVGLQERTPGVSTETSPQVEDFPLNDRGSDSETMTPRGRANSTADFMNSQGTITRHTRAKSMRQLDTTPPMSPSKTFEQKRWSPTKSSWLETALKKSTDGPQQPLPAKPLQPVDLAPRKQVEKTADPTAPSKPSAKPKPPGLSPQADNTPEKSVDAPPLRPTISTKPPVADKPSQLDRSSVISPILRRSPSPEKLEALWKPPPPKPKEIVNFRANLKPRPLVDKANETTGPEFLNARTQLRSTKTQNFKPQDEWKETILSGKAKLQATGGPQKNERPDALKERVLTAKASLKHSSTMPIGQPTKIEPKLMPEASKQLSAPAKISSEKPVISAKPPSDKPVVSAKTSTDKPVVSALASRFNPNLASLLQRGPPPAAKPREEGGASGTGSASEGPGESTPLNHMTKSRARGPKRRAPTSVAAGSKADTPVAPKPPTNISTPAVPKEQKSPLPSFNQPLPIRPSLQPRAKSSSTIHEQNDASTLVSTPQKAKPPTPSKSPLLRASSAESIKTISRRSSAGHLFDDKARTSTPPPIKSPSSKVAVRKVSGERPFPQDNLAASGVQDTIAEEEVYQTPIQATHESSSLRAPESFTPVNPMGSLTTRPPTSSPLLRPLPTLPQRSRSPSPAPQSIVTSTLEEDNSKLLSDFFKGPAVSAPNVDFDIIGLLSASPAVTTPGKVKTIKFEVSELRGHGKLNPVSEDHAHVFMDDSMYLCIHRFAGRSGEEASEVYFWNGSKVSPAAVDDAQLFARKAANDLNTKLIRLTQGHEPPSFLQAIGGIFITRRSSSTNSFLLCGRSLAGSSSVVFDEVDMKTPSLCSGYSFILSTPELVYLWKGRGATRDEIAVGRLVAMQFSGGEFSEINEEEEPDAFFDALGGFEDYSSADYWHLRPNCRKYAPRLFKIDMESGYKVVEIAPFCQGDLDPHEIYVADAFFEFYIFLGSASQSRRTEFQIALKFTQEYAMLAVSIEDRPFMPISSVILGGAPKEFKALFRTWDAAHPAIPNPVQSNPAPVKEQPKVGMRRTRSIRLVGLSDAMEAMRL